MDATNAKYNFGGDFAEENADGKLNDLLPMGVIDQQPGYQSKQFIGYHDSEKNVIIQQPQEQNINDPLNLSQAALNCPMGLEYLLSVDQLLVHQEVDLLEVLVGFETNNKYVIKNSLGQKVYYAVENTGFCTRWCCGPSREFNIKILDNYMEEVIHIHRPLACQSCCFPCCLQSLEVSSPPGNVIGTVEQIWSICKPFFEVKNENGDIVCCIEGTLFQCGFRQDVNFEIFSPNKNVYMGKITKQWSGWTKEMLTDADNFGVTFPLDLDVKVKALIIGAIFLIDFMYFETTKN